MVKELHLKTDLELEHERGRVLAGFDDGTPNQLKARLQKFLYFNRKRRRNVVDAPVQTLYMEKTTDLPILTQKDEQILMEKD
ncbi:MAG: hypothetical protein KAR40_06075 [Candidatus Sabulitectum sp.]|nr:hypothetical protein [Candidatus Sabulitectum sp.]